MKKAELTKKIEELMLSIQKLQEEIRELKNQPQQVHHHYHYQQPINPSPVTPNQPWFVDPYQPIIVNTNSTANLKNMGRTFTTYN